MLNHKHEEILSELSIPRRVWYTTNTGKRSKGTGWLPGVNTCKLIDVNFSVKNKPYIICTFRRDPVRFWYNDSKTSFVAYSAFLFDYEAFSDVCGAYGHPLAERPLEMDSARYTWFVAKRLQTFIGKEIKVVTSIFKEYVTDEYGEREQRNVYYNKQEDKHGWGMDILSYHKIDNDVHVDCDMLYNIYKK